MVLYKGQLITDADIKDLVSDINSYLRNQSALENPNVIGNLIEGQKFVDMINKVVNIQADHCYCQAGGGSPPIVTHNGCPTNNQYTLTSSISNFTKGTLIAAANINKIITDHEALMTACNCDDHTDTGEYITQVCSCNGKCGCEYDCTTNPNCTNNLVCTNNNVCSNVAYVIWEPATLCSNNTVINNVCTNVSVCTNNNVCLCQTNKTFVPTYCSCNTACTCNLDGKSCTNNTVCSCQTYCTCDTACSCNNVCSNNTVCSCNNVCTNNTVCTNNSYCNCEYNCTADDCSNNTVCYCQDNTCSNNNVCTNVTNCTNVNVCSCELVLCECENHSCTCNPVCNCHTVCNAEYKYIPPCGAYQT